MVGFRKTNQDLWLIFKKDQSFETQVSLDEFCVKKSLVFQNSKPVLLIKHNTMFVNLEKNIKKFIIQICGILHNLEGYPIVSANLNPSSVMIDQDSSTGTINQVKINNVEFVNNLKFSEYMPPEVHN